MKRTGLILLMMLASVALKAQTTWGVKIGSGFANISVLDGGDFPNYSAKPTYSGGVYANHKFTSHIGMSGELMYIDKGAELDNNNIHLHYMSLPVLFNYYFVDGKLRFEGGPELGYLVSAESDFWSNEFDFGADFGVAYNIISKLNVGVRSSYSFSDVASVEKRDINNNPDGEISFKNRSFQFYVGYCITCN